MKEKSFFVVSSLSTDHSYEHLSRRKRWQTKKEAEDAAGAIIKQRSAEGRAPLSFYVLQAVSNVGYVAPPVEVTQLARARK
jgi:hypothetical protein